MKSHRVCLTPRTPQRCGVAIVMVIAFYAIGLTVIGVWVRAAVGHQRQVRRWHEKTQATWLAESGLGRAIARIGEDPEYSGERWRPTADELGGTEAAIVVIRVERLAQTGPANESQRETSTAIRIIATARYPADQHRVQATKSAKYRLPTTNDRSGASS